METSLSPKVKTRLFIGGVITPDIRLHLDKHPLYKDHQFDAALKMETVNCEGKEMLGFFIEGTVVDLKALQEEKKRFIERWYLYDLGHINVSIKIFPQILLC